MKKGLVLILGTLALVVGVGANVYLYFRLHNALNVLGLTISSTPLLPTPTQSVTFFPFPTIVPTSTSIPTQIPRKIIPTTIPDPIIDCESNYPNCKGSSIRVRQSQCPNITCCQIGNVWTIYSTSDKCKQDQAAQTQNSQNTVNTSQNVVVPINTVNCIVRYCDGSSYTYQITQERCDSAQKDASVCPTIIPIPTFDTNLQKKYIDNCLAQASNNNQNNRLQINGSARANGGYSNTVITQNNQADNAYIQAIANCHAQYGN